jgi:glycosyltransferase involved in cell wall biosynthesis
MRVIHAAQSIKPAIGIVNQMSWEQESARQLGLDWEVVLYTPETDMSHFGVVLSEPFPRSMKNSFGRFVAWWKLRLGYYRWLHSKENYVDVYMLRYSTADILQLLFIIRCKKPILLVHHTLEVPELLMNNTMSGRLKAIIESALGRLSIRRSWGIVGVTREIISYEQERAGVQGNPAFLYPNGIAWKDWELLDRRGASPEILFVASYFEEWHGLDCLLESIENNKAEFVLHIIGGLSSYQASLIRNDPRIIIHGHKSIKEIEEISGSCWLGLSSFALERKSMREACTLKVREYLALGLPVYAGHVDVFPCDFEYYRQGKAEIEDIIKYAIEMRSESRISVHEASRRYICKKTLVDTLYKQLESQVGLGFSVG